MPFTEEELRRLVAESSTIFERLSPLFTPDSSSESREKSASRFILWQLRVANGKKQRFDRYLQWHGIEPAVANSILGNVNYRGSLPHWISVVEQALLIARSGWTAVAAKSEALREDSEEPFQEVMLPFVEAAKCRLTNRVGPTTAEIGAICRGFEKILLRQLSQVAVGALFAEFGVFRSEKMATSNPHGLETAFASLLDVNKRLIYDSFVLYCYDGGLQQILTSYPVLARLIGTRVLDWIAVTSEFVHAAAADATILQRCFGTQAPIGCITNVVPGLSDPHCHGQTVAEVTFSSGLTVFYKPRPLGIERQFGLLIDWLNEKKPSLRLKAPTMCDCRTHGWMESIRNRDCHNRQGVVRFYRRAGMLLGLSYFLGAADLHSENVIASGEYPILVDLEVLLSAPLRGGDRQRPHAMHALDIGLSSSVLGTGLLPTSRWSVTGEIYRDGGLVRGTRKRVQTAWQYTNTDFMKRSTKQSHETISNLPSVGGIPQSAEDYSECVVSGFKEVAEILKSHNKELLGRANVIEQFRGERSRVVFRSTEVYSAVIRSLLHPKLLCDGVNWSMRLEVLKSSLTVSELKPALWDVYLAEYDQLLHLDVPLFHTVTDSTDIYCDGRVIANDCLAETGYSRALSRVAKVAKRSYEAEMHCIRLALELSAPRMVLGVRNVSNESIEESRCLLDEAARIGVLLRDTAVAIGEDQMNWIGLGDDDNSNSRTLVAAGWDLYDGRCGIALFLAELERAGIALEDSSLAYRVIEPLIDGLTGDGDLYPISTVKGMGAIGLGGIVYSLVRISNVLGSQAAAVAAEKVASLISYNNIDCAENTDVISGLAGALLGLLALYTRCPGDWVIDRARACGSRILERTAKKTDHNAQNGPKFVGDTADGFAHGSAGTAYALARLHKCTGVEQYRVAAVELLSGELVLTDGVTHRDRSGADQSAFGGRGWCRGVAGVGLSKLAVSHLIDESRVMDNFEQLLMASDFETSEDLSRLDQLCCGNMGRIECLLKTAQLTGDCHSHQSAMRAATAIIERAKIRRTYSTSRVDDPFCPGFYHGISGIGYQLLRLVDHTVPSVLLWE